MNTPNRIPHLESVLPRFVTASTEEILYAEQLRREIERRYLAPTDRPPGSDRASGGN
jgi:hypothetical protein